LLAARILSHLLHSAPKLTHARINAARARRITGSKCMRRLIRCELKTAKEMYHEPRRKCVEPINSSYVVLVFVLVSR
jgi:hypothetical protein